MKKSILKRVATHRPGLDHHVAFLGLMVVVPAATAMTAAQKPSTNVLVPVSAAKAAGFTKAVTAPTTSTDTSVTGCPDGAQEEYANASGTSGLLSEVLYCATAADAAELLQGIAAQSKAEAGQKPPKTLGSTAVERLGSGSTYLIAWQHGTAFELTGLSEDLSASSTTSTTEATTVPLTAHDQQVLANAATQQNARFESVSISSGTGGSAADAKAQAAADAASVAAGCPKSPSTALKKTKWSSAPAMTIDPAKTYTRHREDRCRYVRRRSRCEGCTRYGQQLRLPRTARVLQLRDLPSGDPNIHGSDRRSDGNRLRWPGIHHC